MHPIRCILCVIFIMCMLVYAVPAHAATNDTAEQLDLFYSGQYSTLLQDNKISAELRLQAELETGHYAEIIKRYGHDKAVLTFADDQQWPIRAALAEAYRRSGQRAAYQKLLKSALDYQSQHQADLNAQSASALAYIIGEERIKLAWDLVQIAHEKNKLYAPAYLVGAEITMAGFAWHFVLGEASSYMRMSKEDVRALPFAARALMADNKFSKAHELLDTALEKNPHLVGALNVKCLLALQERKYDEMGALIKRALAVNSRHSETLALSAAYADVMGKDKERDALIEQALAVNARAHVVFAILAEAAERRYLYEDSLKWGRRAQEVNPDYWQGDYIVAVNLLRLGEEPEGYALMEKAFEKNKFNVWAYNMLTVLDEDFKESKYVQHETEHFIFKLPQKIDAQLSVYLKRWLDPMYQRMQERYQYSPMGPKAYKGKILILFFDDHGKFSARTVGLPGLGANGATFGSVVTMPINDRDDLEAAHPWFSTLEHEIAHVFTIQKTKRLIPRWLTEGISEWQEGDPHINLDAVLLNCIANDELPSYATMSDGIHYPKYPMQIGLYYYLSALAIDLLRKEYGAHILNTILDEIAKGKDIVEILQQQSGKSLEQLDKEFHAYVKEHAQNIIIAPQIGPREFKDLEAAHKEKSLVGEERVRYAHALLQFAKVAEARVIAEELAESDEWQNQGLILQALIEMRFARNSSEALSILSLILAIDEEHPYANYLALLASMREKDWSTASVYGQAAKQLMPRATRGPNAVFELLRTVYEEEGDQDSLQQLYKAHRDADSYYYPAQRRYALDLYKRQDWQVASDALERCLHFTIYDAHLHACFAHCQEQLGDKELALRLYKVAAAMDETNEVAESGLDRLQKD